MKKALALAGSPRRGGNSDLLLQEFMKGVSSRGCQVEIIYVSQLKISPCVECNSCYKTGECVIKDDMQGVYPRLLDSDYLIVATPVFFMGPSAQLKALIDRCQAIWARKYILKKTWDTSGKKGFLIATCALTKKEGVFAGAINTAKAFFHVLGFKYSGELVFSGLEEKGEIARRPEALCEAFNAGRDLVTE